MSIKLSAYKWVDSPILLPSKSGVYCITSEKSSNAEVLYVGQAKNLKARLQGKHQGWQKANVEYSHPWIGYELIQDEKQRKIREHLIIGQMEPQYNDGDTNIEKRWQLLSQKSILDLNAIHGQVNEEMINHVSNWLELAWNNLDNAKGLTLLEGSKKDWVSEYPNAWKSHQELIETYKGWDNFQPSQQGIVGTCRGKELMALEHLAYCGFSDKILDSLLKMQGKIISIKAYDSDHSVRLSHATKALLSIQDYLNPEFMNAWSKFLKYSKLLGKQGVYDHAGDTVIDFLDHCIAWSLVLDVPYLRLLPQERTWWFNEIYLEGVYRNKHQVEDWVKSYISSDAFVIGFQKWCNSHDFIPEVLWQNEEYNAGNRVRVQK